MPAVKGNGAFRTLNKAVAACTAQQRVGRRGNTVLAEPGGWSADSVPAPARSETLQTEGSSAVPGTML